MARDGSLSLAMVPIAAGRGNNPPPLAPATSPSRQLR